MRNRLYKWFCIASIVVIGIIHFLLAPAEYEEAHYIGFLFGANSLAAIIAAIGILRGNNWGWALGLLTVAGSLAAYIWSRTVGMPGMEVEEWFTPSGVLAMVLEGVFILLFLLQPWKTTATHE